MFYNKRGEWEKECSTVKEANVKRMFYSKRGEWEKECSTVKEANGKNNVLQ